MRNSLTTVGISVGVASLVAMLSLGIGLQQMASRRLMKSGLFDTVVVTSRRDAARDEPRRRAQRADSGRKPHPGRGGAHRKSRQLPNVSEAYPDIRFATELRFEDKPHMTMISALPESAKSNDAFEGMQGSFFSSDAAPEAILQKSFAEELLGKTPRLGAPEPNVAELAKPLLGKELTMVYAQRATSSDAAAASSNPANEVMGASYSVVSARTEAQDRGRGRSRSGEHARSDAGESVSAAASGGEPARDAADRSARDLAGRSDQPVYSSISVRVKNPSRVQEVEDAIKKMGFTTFSILDASRGLRQFFAVLYAFLGIFGSLALMVASIGIVNTLVMAILERRREIGIMKAIGASDGDVKKLFFAEAGAMGILGGIVGVALGWAIGQVINVGTNVYLKRQSLPPEHFWAVPWWLVGVAIGFAFVVSLVSGLYPAGRAARLDPVQALRYE